MASQTSLGIVFFIYFNEQNAKYFCFCFVEKCATDVIIVVVNDKFYSNFLFIQFTSAPKHILLKRATFFIERYV